MSSLMGTSLLHFKPLVKHPHLPQLAKVRGAAIPPAYVPPSCREHKIEFDRSNELQEAQLKLASRKAPPLKDKFTKKQPPQLSEEKPSPGRPYPGPFNIMVCGKQKSDYHNFEPFPAKAGISKSRNRSEPIKDASKDATNEFVKQLDYLRKTVQET